MWATFLLAPQGRTESLPPPTAPPISVGGVGGGSIPASTTGPHRACGGILHNPCACSVAWPELRQPPPGLVVDVSSQEPTQAPYLCQKRENADHFVPMSGENRRDEEVGVEDGPVNGRWVVALSLTYESLSDAPPEQTGKADHHGTDQDTPSKRGRTIPPSDRHELVVLEHDRKPGRAQLATRRGVAVPARCHPHQAVLCSESPGRDRPRISDTRTAPPRKRLHPAHRVWNGRSSRGGAA